MPSLESNALEPTRSELARMSRGEAIRQQLPVYGLPLLTLLLVAVFSVLLPDTFPTALNLRSILSDKSIVAMLSLAAMLPMICGRIDLTVGFGIALWHVMAISLQVKYGFDWRIAVLCVLAAGLAFGFVNGLLVEVAKIDSFIATLGTGTILYAVANWHTAGRQVTGVLAHGFLAINNTWVPTPVGPLPVTAFYVLALTLVIWLVTERLPLGRYMYAIGANPKAAALNGIAVRSHVIGVFAVSGLLTAFVGVVLASKLRIGQSSVGQGDYLLPALVGAFLGSTTIKPGRVNAWGTIVGVAILAVGISGMDQLGADFFITPLFNGATLIVSIGLAGYSQRRRSVARIAPNVT